MALTVSQNCILLWDLNSLSILRVIDDYSNQAVFMKFNKKIALIDEHTGLVVYKSMNFPETFLNAKTVLLSNF
jgi:hypothetical protein